MLVPDPLQREGCSSPACCCCPGQGAGPGHFGEVGGTQGQCWGLRGRVGTLVWLSAAHPHLSLLGEPGGAGAAVLGQREAWAAPGVPRAHTGGGSKGCALGRQQCQGALSPCSRLCWGVARVISLFDKVPWCPHPTRSQGQPGSHSLSEAICAMWPRQGPVPQPQQWGLSLLDSVGLGII